jgi:hypothetical protein
MVDSIEHHGFHMISQGIVHTGYWYADVKAPCVHNVVFMVKNVVMLAVFQDYAKLLKRSFPQTLKYFFWLNHVGTPLGPE